MSSVLLYGGRRRAVPLAVRLADCEQRFVLPVRTLFHELAGVHRFTPLALAHFLDVVSKDEVLSVLRDCELPVVEPAPQPAPSREPAFKKPRVYKPRPGHGKAKKMAKPRRKPEGIPLSAEMRRLFERRHEPGVCDEIALRNVGLISTQATVFKQRGTILEWMDLFQEGYFALRRSVETYDPNRGYAFSTYASWIIRRWMMNAIHDQGQTVRVPRSNVPRLLGQISRTQDRQYARHGIMPTEQEIARLTRIPEATVRQGRQLFLYRSVQIVVDEDEAEAAAEAGEHETALAPHICGTDVDALHHVQALYRQARIEQADVLEAMRGSVLRGQAFVCRNLGLCTLFPEKIRDMGAQESVSHNAVFQTRNRALRHVTGSLGVGTDDLRELGRTIREIEEHFAGHDEVSAS